MWNIRCYASKIWSSRSCRYVLTLMAHTGMEGLHIEGRMERPRILRTMGRQRTDSKGHKNHKVGDS